MKRQRKDKAMYFPVDIFRHILSFLDVEANPVYYRLNCLDRYAPSHHPALDFHSKLVIHFWRPPFNTNMRRQKCTSCGFLAPFDRPAPPGEQDEEEEERGLTCVRCQLRFDTSPSYRACEHLHLLAQATSIDTQRAVLYGGGDGGDLVPYASFIFPDKMIKKEFLLCGLTKAAAAERQGDRMIAVHYSKEENNFLWF